MTHTLRIEGKLPKLTEAQFLRQVLQLAKLHGWRTAHFRPGMRRSGKWETAVQGDGKGFPDLILVKGARLLAVELKVGTRQPTPEQQGWLAALRQVPGVYDQVWYPDDWPWIEATLSA